MGPVNCIKLILFLTTIFYLNSSYRNMATKFFNVSFERTFKIISKIFLQIFHIKLKSWNILTESNELSAILD